MMILSIFSPLSRHYLPPEAPLVFFFFSFFLRLTPLIAFFDACSSMFCCLLMMLYAVAFRQIRQLSPTPTMLAAADTFFTLLSLCRCRLCFICRLPFAAMLLFFAITWLFARLMLRHVVRCFC